MIAKMNNRLLCIISGMLISTFSVAQTDTTAVTSDTTYWRRSLNAGANVNQAAFSDNWKSGGTNSIALGLFLNAKANYKKDQSSWDNEVQLKYGIVRHA